MLIVTAASQTMKTRKSIYSLSKASCVCRNVTKLLIDLALQLCYYTVVLCYRLFTFPQFLQWCRLRTMVKGILQDEQQGASSSGTHRGGSVNTPHNGQFKHDWYCTDVFQHNIDHSHIKQGKDFETLMTNNSHTVILPGYVFFSSHITLYMPVVYLLTVYWPWT